MITKYSQLVLAETEEEQVKRYIKKIKVLFRNPKDISIL